MRLSNMLRSPPATLGEFMDWAMHFIRFIAVGAANTAVGYSVFVLLYTLWLRQEDFGYLVALFASYAVAVPLAYVLYRRFVFGSSKESRGQLLRFITVYGFGIAANAFVLPVLVELVELSPIFGQGLALGVTALLSYFGHRFLSFRH